MNEVEELKLKILVYKEELSIKTEQLADARVKLHTSLEENQRLREESSRVQEEAIRNATSPVAGDSD